MKEILIFNGIHSAGKSTLAQLLAHKTGHPFYKELGHEILQSHNFQLFPELDQTIMDQELARDTELLQVPTLPIVETWHIGNLAYAQLRDKDTYKIYLQALDQVLQHISPIAIYVTISETTFKSRYNENYFNKPIKEMIHFYRHIEDTTLTLYSKYKIPYISVANDTNVDQTYQQLIEKLKNETQLSF
jgi:nicotinamide riboside kinase